MFGLRMPVDTREHTGSWYAASRSRHDEYGVLEGHYRGGSRHRRRRFQRRQHGAWS